MFEPVEIRVRSGDRKQGFVTPSLVNSMDGVGIEFSDARREVVNGDPGRPLPGVFWMIWKNAGLISSPSLDLED